MIADLSVLKAERDVATQAVQNVLDTEPFDTARMRVAVDVLTRAVHRYTNALLESVTP